MVSDDNEKLRQFLNPTAALIFAMEAVRRTNIVADRTAWVSYKGFAQRYMAIINRLPQDFLALTLLSRYNTSDMRGPSGSLPSYHRQIFDGVYADLLVLRSYLENTIGITDDERRAITDFFQARLRPAMLEPPDSEKDVQDTVERLLIGRGLQKGQDYDRETGRVKVSSKESVPDFILPRLEEAVEIKLVKDRRRIREVIDEINADIAAYSTKYLHLLFIVYDLGRRQLVLPVATTIFAGRDGVIIRYGGAVDYRPTNQAIEAETYGRQDTGNGSGQGWDERAFSAQVAEWPIAVAGETGASVAHSARSLRRGVGG